MDPSALSGWMRIGVVLSMLFFLFSSWYGLGVWADDVDRLDSMYRTTCNRKHKNDVVEWSKCQDFARDEAIRVIRPRSVYVLGYAIFPLVSFWIFAFISGKIARWIAVGFRKKESS